MQRMPRKQIYKTDGPNDDRQCSNVKNTHMSTLCRHKINFSQVEEEQFNFRQQNWCLAVMQSYKYKIDHETHPYDL